MSMHLELIETDEERRTHALHIQAGALSKLLSTPKRNVRRRQQAPFRDAHDQNLICIITVVLYRRPV